MIDVVSVFTLLACLFGFGWKRWIGSSLGLLSLILSFGYAMVLSIFGSFILSGLSRFQRGGGMGGGAHLALDCVGGSYLGYRRAHCDLGWGVPLRERSASQDLKLMRYRLVL